MPSILSATHYHSPDAARAFLESILWANGRKCPHCGTIGQSSLMGGKSTRPGLYKCYACRKPFTVTVGTIFESSHAPLHLWLQAIYLLSSSKKGISSNQLSRVLCIGLKSAWFMAHRIREAMKRGVLPLMGGPGAVIEADETYFGRKKGMPVKQGIGHKLTIVSLVERGGTVRSFHVNRISSVKMFEILYKNIDPKSRLNTDESVLYKNVGSMVSSKHETVIHGFKEYARGDVTTNHVEGYFSVFKRGMRGVYQQCSERHLHRYLSEFDFRYNQRVALGVDDFARTKKAIEGAQGKRLTYASAKRAVS